MPKVKKKKDPVEKYKKLDLSKVCGVPYKLSSPRTCDLPSYSGSISMDSCGAKKQNRYTGDKLMGIATMHKSNAVPIFKAEEAEEIAKMRRN